MPQKPRGRGKTDEAPKKRHAGPRAEGEKSDEIADLAAAHWGADATSATYSEEVVERLYSTYLASGKGGRAHAMKLQRLEMSGYLENYLWKHFDAASAWRLHSPLSVSPCRKIGRGVSCRPICACTRMPIGSIFRPMCRCITPP